MSGIIGTNSNRGSGSIGTASAGADTALSNLVTLGKEMTCVAWLNMNGTGTIAINDSGGHNGVSAITDISSGRYQVTLNSAMPNIHYSTTATIIGSTSGGYSAFIAPTDFANTTTNFQVTVMHHNGSTGDMISVNVTVHGGSS